MLQVFIMWAHKKEQTEIDNISVYLHGKVKIQILISSQYFLDSSTW